MDLATIIGLVCSFALVLMGMLMGEGSMLDKFMTFVDIPSVAIVLGGTLGCTLTSTPLANVANLGKIMKNAFFAKPIDTKIVIDQFIDFANRARREGILSLEGAVNAIGDDYLRKGMQLTVDGMEPQIIEEILNGEIDNLESRHQTGIELVNALATFAPALGMIGTVIGLVAMLKNLNDPSAIGPAMAVALITTFYGAILANLVFIPISNKLKTRSAAEVQLREMQLQGVLAIAKGENPRLIQEKLNSFQPPKQRQAT
ncbi:MAG: motility protein A [Desulfovibrionaceae bacterium]|nr:motility protein A [Desulfovibrionaceae bacterium]